MHLNFGFGLFSQEVGKWVSPIVCVKTMEGRSWLLITRDVYVD